MRIPKILFKNPTKNKVVVFDDEGSQILKTTVLNGTKCTIVHCRKEIFHITLPLLFLMLKNAMLFLVRSRSLDLKGTTRCSLLGYIYRVYLFSCIDYIKPKVVLTFIDNNYSFHWISRMHKHNNCEYYAIQNGMRVLTNTTSMPHLFCFGECEVDLYKKHNQDVDNFYPVGSLKGGYYKTCISRSNTKVDFDICFVSDLLLSFTKGHVLSKFELGVSLLYKLLHKYLAENPLTCCIAMRSTDKHDRKVEKEYLVSIFGNRVKIIERNDMQMSTYTAMDRSSVVLSWNSTAVYEAFGWGKKALLCNLSGDESYQLPLPEICTMNVNNYEIFKSKLDYLRQLDENEYRELIKSHARYLMNYDFDNPAHIVIRKMILEHLQ